MLTLIGATQVGGLSVYRDVVVDGERTARTSKVHVAGNVPRLVLHDDGWPALWLTRYRGAPGDRERAGAVLSLSLDLSPASADLEALAQSLEPGSEIVLLQPTAGTITLAVAGSSQSDDLIRTISGPRSASLMGRQRASFIVDLSADGATLLDAALSEELPVMHVAYELTFNHVVEGVRIRAWADLEAASLVLSDRARDELADPATILSTMRERKLVGLSVEVLEAEVDADTLTQLQEIAQEALNLAVVDSLLAPADAEGIRRVQRPPTKKLDLRIDQGMVLSATTGVTGLLTLDLPEQAGRIRQIDTDVETRLDVELHCTIDFEASPVDVVRLTWELPSTGATDTLRFRAGASQGRIRTPRGTGGPWRYRVELWFDGRTEPLTLPWVETEETLVVLDLDGVGVLDVDLRLQTLALGEFRAASVELEHPASTGTDGALLDPLHPTFRWTRVTAEHPARPWRARVAWLAREGEERVVGEWQERSGRALPLMPPEVLAPTSEILVVSVGPFEDLRLVLCELRLVGTEQGETLEFSASGASQVWLRPANAPWEHRQTRVRPDGTRQTDPWTREDDPILVIRDPWAALVTVVPLALRAVEGLRLAQVQLRPAGTDSGDTLLSFQPDDPPRLWRFRSTAFGEFTYSYRQILITTDARVLEGDWITSSSRVLVLKPPSD